MMSKTERKQITILRILKEADRSLDSSRICRQLQATGIEASERTVRYYLLGMDKKGFTENHGKRGRLITQAGLRELETADVFEKVGFLSAKIDRMIYIMDFDLKKRKGRVIINISLIDKESLRLAIPRIISVYHAQYSMGKLVTLYGAGEKVGEIVIPDNMVGIGTVCSVTLDGVLLANGVPTHSRFGGLLELRDGEPFRFVEIINYDGTSMDPLEIFIRSGMTDYLGAAESRNGRIGVGFREAPAESRDRIIDLGCKLEDSGLGAFMTIGWPGQPLIGVPVSEGRVGFVVIGGLTPPAILEEIGIKVNSRALAGLADYEDLFPYWELNERIHALS
jgi:HTH-type transcriptional regulator, global nitrogen regulator NrpRI